MRTNRMQRVKLQQLPTSVTNKERRNAPVASGASRNTLVASRVNRKDVTIIGAIRSVHLTLGVNRSILLVGNAKNISRTLRKIFKSRPSGAISGKRRVS